MNNWKKVTLIVSDGKEVPNSWVNMNLVTVITVHKDGSQLEITEGFIYVCKEKAEYLIGEDNEDTSD